ncbi:hypothetical protein ACT453_43495, partial [Bacillus sp. D-CC]
CVAYTASCVGKSSNAFPATALSVVNLISFTFSFPSSREDYKPGETREGIIGLILDDGKEKVKDIKFTTDNAVAGDAEAQDGVKEPQTFHISLSK